MVDFLLAHVEAALSKQSEPKGQQAFAGQDAE